MISKKLIVAIMIISSFSKAEITDLNITNNCEGLKLYDVVWMIKEKDWNGKRSSFLKYSLKNTLDTEIKKIKTTTYLLGDNNHIIMESVKNEGDIKAHYHKPMNNSTYYGISPAPSEFIGKGELLVTCKQKEVNKKKALKKGFTDIRIKDKLYDSIKAKTKTKTDLETKMSIFLSLSLVDKEGGILKIIEKLKRLKKLED